MNTTLTPEFFQLVRALRDKASTEKWVVKQRPFSSVNEISAMLREHWLSGPDGGLSMSWIDVGDRTACIMGNGPKGGVNASLVAVAVNLLPELLGEIEALRALLERRDAQENAQGQPKDP